MVVREMKPIDDYSDNFCDTGNDSHSPCSMIMSISTYWNVKLHIAKQDKKRIDIIKCHLVLLWYKLIRWFMTEYRFYKKTLDK